MKSKRQKKIRNQYSFYKQNFNFPKKPTIILDGNFLKIMHDLSLQMSEKLENIFQTKINLKTTKCVKNELSKIPILKNVHEFSKSIKEVKCVHKENFLQANFCLKKLIGYKNKGKVVLASQDEFLKNFGKKNNFLPIIFFFRGNILKMEEVSDITKDLVEKNFQKNLNLENRNFKKIYKDKKIFRDLEATKKYERIKRGREKLGVRIKKKRAKAPNSLSCRKKKIKKNK